MTVDPLLDLLRADEAVLDTSVWPRPVQETDQEYVIKADLPDVKKEDVKGGTAGRHADD